MERHDDNYKNVELLKALDPPIDERPLKKRKLPDYKTLPFFGYEQCLAFYTKRIMNKRERVC